MALPVSPRAGLWNSSYKVTYPPLNPTESLVIHPLFHSCVSLICCSSPRLKPRLLSGTQHQLIRHVFHHKMELSESVQTGLRCLADPATFDRTGFQVLVDASFRSLLSSRGDPTVLGEPAPPLFCLPLLLPVPLRADVQSRSLGVDGCFFGHPSFFSCSAACCELPVIQLPVFMFGSVMRREAAAATAILAAAAGAKAMLAFSPCCLLCIQQQLLNHSGFLLLFKLLTGLV